MVVKLCLISFKGEVLYMYIRICFICSSIMNLCFHYVDSSVDNLVGNLERMSPDMSITLSRPMGNCAVLQVIYLIHNTYILCLFFLYF